MRIIHTADWHIGQTLAGFDREHEQRAVLRSLVAAVEATAADAVVVAGDIYDHQNPSGEAQRLFFETIIALRRARPRAAIVIVAGNHDAAGRLEAPAALLRQSNIHVVGNVRRIDGRIDPRRHLVMLPDAAGVPSASVLAVSYPTPACLPPFGSLDPDGGGSRIAEATRALYAELLEGTGAHRLGLPLLVTGHLHVAGGLESEGAERRILVGGEHAVPASVFPAEAAYVALGHLHKPQSVGRETVRYAGSLLPLSAAEAGYRHGVSLLTLASGKVTVEHMAIPRPVPFLRLPAQGGMAIDELGDRLAALGLPQDLPPEQRPFVQVQLLRAGLPHNFRARVDEVAATFPVRLVGIALSPAGATADAVAIAATTMRLAEISPEAMFEQAYARAFGRKPEAAHSEAFHRVAAAALAEV